MSSYTDLTDATTRSLNNLIAKGTTDHGEHCSRQIVCAAARVWLARMQPMAETAAPDDESASGAVGEVPAVQAQRWEHPLWCDGGERED